MKQLILIFLTSFFVLSSCTFLGGKSSPDSSYEEDSMDDESFAEDEGFSPEDEDLMEEELVEDEAFDSEDEDVFDTIEDDSDEEFAEEDTMEEEPKKKGLKGFFSRLFGSKKKKQDTAEELEDPDLAENDYTEDYEDQPLDTTEDYTSSQEEEETTTTTTEAEEEGSLVSQDDTVEEALTESPPETTESAEPVVEKKASIPLNKIISVPYKKANYLVNAVYIARPGDDLQTVSQKIYNADQSKMLLTINPHLKNRQVKVGDKIYYNSPLRAEDDSQLLFYYQEMRAPSSSYNLAPGDNIREVASQLLGHPNSWKEIWATNPGLVSKGKVTKNVNIEYWPENMASASPTQEPSQPMPQEPSQEANQEPNPPETPEMQGEMQGEMQAPLPEPPSQPEETALARKGDFPQPPPEVKQPAPEKKSGLLKNILNQQVILALIAILVILILMIRLILKKRKEKDFDYTATNIEV